MHAVAAITQGQRVRFDKALWRATWHEYEGKPKAPSLGHFTERAQVLIAAWLEKVNDERTPITRGLCMLFLPDALAEAARAAELWREDSKRHTRLLGALRAVARNLDRPAPPAHTAEALRSCQACAATVLDWITWDKDDRKKKGAAAVTALGVALTDPENQEAVRAALAREYVERAMTASRTLLHRDDFLRHIGREVERWTLVSAPPSADEVASLEGMIESFVAGALTSGHSRESLSELLVKYLRGDNERMATKGLEERLRIALNAVGAERQEYTAYFALDGAALQVDGEIFPPGVSLISNSAAENEVADALEANDEVTLPWEVPPGSTSTLRVNLTEYMSSVGQRRRPRPRDVFQAARVGAEAAHKCLDTVFLLEDRAPAINPTGFVLATSSADAKPSQFGMRIDLERRSRREVQLHYVRAIPHEWVDALHWYTHGCLVEKPEIGIVNLWTVAELISRNVAGPPAGGDIARTEAALVPLATVALWVEEQRYLGAAVAAYARHFSGLVGEDDRSWTSVWRQACEAQTPSSFPEFPHLQAVMIAWRDAHASKQLAGRMDEIGDLAQLILRWGYGYRNEVVHNGRSSLVGAEIARLALRDLLQAVLVWSLRLESRALASSLSECFTWGRQCAANARMHLTKNEWTEALRLLEV